MSYESRYALATDQTFRDRVVACAVMLAPEYTNSTDIPSAMLGRAVIRAAENALGLVKLAASQPGFEAIADQATLTDQQVRDAVQMSWETYAYVLYPPTVGTPGPKET